MGVVTLGGVDTRALVERALADDELACGELYDRLAVVARVHFALIDNEPIKANAVGYWQPSTNEIHIDATHSQLQKTKTLAHELAHALAGHGKSGEAEDPRELENVAEMPTEPPLELKPFTITSTVRLTATDTRAALLKASQLLTELANGTPQ